MINAPHDKEFVFHDGSRCRNILELGYKIEGMHDHTFHHFVNHSKNDFANWISHVLGDHELAEKLRKTHSREATLMMIKDRVAEISAAMAHNPTLGGGLVHPHNVHDHNNDAKKEMHHEEKHEPKHEVKQNHNYEHKKEHHEHKKEVHQKSKDEFTDLNVVESKIKESKPYESRPEPRNAEIKISENKIFEPVISRAEKSEKIAIEKSRENNGRQWFKIFSRTSKDELAKIELKEERKRSLERALEEDIDENGRENTLWGLLYFLLVVLILGLLAYKLFFE